MFAVWSLVGPGLLITMPPTGATDILGKLMADPAETLGGAAEEGKVAA